MKAVIVERQISELKDVIDLLQKKYGTSWEVFNEKFRRGELCEDADFVEWHAAVELLDELRRERDMLTEVLS